MQLSIDSSPKDSFDEVKAIIRDLEGPVDRGTDLPSRAPSRGRMILLASWLGKGNIGPRPGTYSTLRRPRGEAKKDPIKSFEFKLFTGTLNELCTRVD